MAYLIGFLILAASAAAAALALVLRGIASPKENFPITPEWVREVSVERYRPLLRLLDTRDFAFLISQPGFSPDMINRLRHSRCRIFRGYLKELSADFRSLCLAIKLIMVQSEIDRPDLARFVLRSQLEFAAQMVCVHARLLLFEVGLGHVEIGSLLNLFDGLRVELRSLVPSSAVLGG